MVTNYILKCKYNYIIYGCAGFPGKFKIVKT